MLSKVCGRVVACAELNGEYCLLVDKAVLIARVTEHATKWSFSPDSLALWSSVEACVAWYRVKDDVVVLTA